nr:uncharacterized protein CG13380-like [Drosophila bipectinata]
MDLQKSTGFPNIHSVYKYCICDRKRNVIYCNLCKQSFVGRISQLCPKHPEVTFLMDARHCAFCGAHVSYLQITDQK